MSDKTLVERLRDMVDESDKSAVNSITEYVYPVKTKTAEAFLGKPCVGRKGECELFMAIADAIEREYLPRPRFEDGELVREGDTICIDGELPLKVYWYSVRSDGLTVFSCPTSSRQIKTGERVKRPEPDALDADGVPIRVGDTVWNVNTGERCTVKEITTRTKKAFKGSKVITHTITVEMEGAFYKDGTLMSLDRCNITHKEPDSLERIESDVKKTLSGVFYKDEVLDLLRRQREVLERK